MTISPFSLQNEWVIHWKRIPSNMKERPIIGQVAKTEEEALNALASVGLISGKQMLNIFSLGKKKLKKMVDRHRIVKHELVMNKKYRIPIYSLGVNGAKIAGVTGYENNYWVEYTIEEILKRLLFFEFYERFYPRKLFPAPSPFTGAIVINDKPMYVYVARGDLNDLIMFLKWNNMNERIIIITESLSFLEHLKMYINNMKLRIILDENLINKTKSIGNSFYMLHNNEFIKEGEV